MKKLWSKIKEIWATFWKDDEYDLSKNHLSWNDKRSLWYGAFMMSMIIMIVNTLIIVKSNIRVAAENSKDIGKMMKMITAYMATATEDEYDDIAQSIRHDLVFSEFGEDIENAARYIPNNAKNCCTCRENYPEQVYLLCTNTGVLYGLDLFENGKEENKEQSGFSYSFGYDEISQASVSITKIPHEKKGNVEISRQRGIVSVHKMKSLFCDECISRILNTVENQLVEEFVIFDSADKMFYPVESETQVKIGDYNLEVNYEDSDYEIAVLYVGK